LVSRLPSVLWLLIFYQLFLKVVDISVDFRLSREASREAEITNLNVAIVVDENIGWLEIPMNNIGRVDRVYRTEEVIQDSNYVLFLNFNFLAIHQQVP
jgi:hypothetical protein